MKRERKCYIRKISCVTCVKLKKKKVMQKEVLNGRDGIKERTIKIRELIRKPPDSKLVSCKWIYKRKEGIFGVEPERFEARLVAQGFT